jgi:hypothetical protein
MTDVQQTWKKHGWVPPSTQEKYTHYWELIKNPKPRISIPDIHILETPTVEYSLFAELQKNICGY